MSLDDFLKGIAAFDKGLGDFAESAATADAQEQLATINQQFGQDPMNQERQQAVDSLSQNFALRLTQAGASAAEVQQSAGRIGLTEFQNRQLGRQQEQSEAKLEIEKIKALRAGQDPFKVFNMRLQQEKFLRDTAENFESQTRDLREGIESADKAMAAINLGTENAAASGAVGTMLAKALQPGNLTDREQAVFKGNRALENTAKRLYRTFVSGEGFTEKDKQELTEYVTVMKQANVETFNTRKKDFIKGNAASISGVGMRPERLDKALDTFKYTKPSETIQKSLTQIDLKINELSKAIKDKKFFNALPKKKRQLYEQNYKKAVLQKRLKMKYLNSIKRSVR